MKKVVSFLSILATTVAVASTVESDNVFGVLKLDIGTAVGQTIIGVPWENVGGGDIDVNKIMLTNNLATGDKLYYFNYATKKFQIWELNLSTGWDAQTTVPEREYLEAVVNENQSIPRGAALILSRESAGPVGGGSVYLYGQYLSSDAVTTITPRTSARATDYVYNLIAPSRQEGVPLNRAIYFSNSEATSALTGDYSWKNEDLNGDKIILTDGTMYSHDSNGWYVMKRTGESPTSPKVKSYEDADVLIPMGKGAWYMRNGTSNLYIKW